MDSDAIVNLFALDTQTGTLHELPQALDSEDCTSDTCTQTCSGCVS